MPPASAVRRCPSAIAPGLVASSRGASEPRRSGFSRGAVASALAATLLLGGTPAAATVWKCQGPENRPFYQDTPCPPGKELRDFDKDPPTVSVLPLSPSPGPSSRVSEAPPAKPAPKAKAARAGKPAPTPREVAERRFIAPGIEQGEVITRLGPPDLRHGGSRQKTTRWTYLPQPEDPGTITTLTFEHGRLVEVERKVVR